MEIDSVEMKDLIQTIDGQMGRIVGQLEKMGILDKTLIVVTSDHGMTGLKGIVDFPFRLQSELSEELQREVLHILLGSTVGIYHP